MTANAFLNIAQIDPSLEGPADSLRDISERTSIDCYCMPLPGAIFLRYDLQRPRFKSGELTA
jgi:hypothetical protein